MGSKSKTEKSVKDEKKKKKKKKKKIMALAPIAKPKKLSKRTLKLVREEDISTKEKKERKRIKLDGEMKRTKLGGKKKMKEEHESEDDGMGCMSLATESRQSETQIKIESSAEPQLTGKSKRSAKKKKKDRLLSKSNSKPMKKRNDAVADEVYQISSGDEDCSKGIKKWLTEYHQSRPGLDILQQRIDEFITAHEEREEQARQEREARAAEGGWTVVVHHKGRKKTTDESGITVGSVAQAAVVDKMAKKKSKEVGIDFYRFQRREAQRNEVMMLQSKFEQDRKRIQQLRAARKFKPY
ncbi:Ribosomal RNA-processing protein 7 [Macleaya cordata]|uniref:Ribosomal RNA-processing protein 7 n=1 Tax=Macleaya cordata TaxID=56857 RepID=A0A200QPW1_MACCD|nr:Ribosomal RNA-processing protein 7 [Macleaya cordata]